MHAPRAREQRTEDVLQRSLHEYHGASQEASETNARRTWRACSCCRQRPASAKSVCWSASRRGAPAGDAARQEWKSSALSIRVAERRHGSDSGSPPPWNASSPTTTSARESSSQKRCSVVRWPGARSAMPPASVWELVSSAAPSSTSSGTAHKAAVRCQRRRMNGAWYASRLTNGSAPLLPPHSLASPSAVSASAACAPGAPCTLGDDMSCRHRQVSRGLRAAQSMAAAAEAAAQHCRRALAQQTHHDPGVVQCDKHVEAVKATVRELGGAAEGGA
jgi:hypothetical protein